MALIIRYFEFLRGEWGEAPTQTCNTKGVAKKIVVVRFFFGNASFAMYLCY